MKSSATTYAIGATLAGCAAAIPAAWAPAPGWLVSGVVAMALPGVASGTLLAREFGRPGRRFVVAFGAGIAGRLVFGGGVALASAAVGPEARAAALAGVAAGFVATMLFEAVWFSRAAARRARAAEGRG